MQVMDSNPIPSMLVMLNSTISNTKIKKTFFILSNLSLAKKLNKLTIKMRKSNK
jgi:hypothetical protein